MHKLLVSLILLLSISSALGQGNPTCPTRPFGDNSNACASTAFVQTAITTLPLLQGNIFVGDSSNIATATTPAATTIFLASRYGVLCDGATDDAPALRALIALLPLPGSKIKLPVTGNDCLIGSSVTLGNGGGNLITNVSTANSTRNGVGLIGVSNGTSTVEMIPAQASVTLRWTGATAVAVSGAANVAGLIRLTVSSTAGYSTGDQLAVNGVVGTVEANNVWTVNVVDGTHFDLQNSTFSNAWVSGGYIGPIMLKVAGPTSGTEISGLVLDCNTKCATALMVTSVTSGEFKNLLAKSYYGSAYILNAYASGVNLAQGLMHSPFINVRSSGPIVGSGATGITIGSATVGAAVLDVSENTFIDCLFTWDAATAGSSGILLQFADALTFVGVSTQPQGVQVANSFGLRVVPPTGVGGAGFPSGITFFSPVALYGNVNNPGAGWTTAQGIQFVGYPNPGVGGILLPAANSPGQFFGTTADGHAFGYKDLFLGVDIRDSAARQIGIGSTTGDSCSYFGQSTTRSLIMCWTFNATPGSAFASLSTNGNSNPLAINASSVLLQNASGGTIYLGTGTGLLQTSAGLMSYLAPGTGVATWLSTPSSANLAAAVTDETGTGPLVFATSPTLTGNIILNGNTLQISTPTPTGSGASGVDVSGNIEILFIANEASRATVRYGLTLGNWAEFSAFSSSQTLNGLIIGTNPAKPIVIGTNNIERLRLDGSGTHLKTSGTAPALTSCGTSPSIIGTDMEGEVTMGTAAPTGCVITFNVAYGTAVRCTVTWQATPLASQSYVYSTAAITLTQTGTSSNKVNYICHGS